MVFVSIIVVSVIENMVVSGIVIGMVSVLLLCLALLVLVSVTSMLVNQLVAVVSMTSLLSFIQEGIETADTKRSFRDENLSLISFRICKKIYHYYFNKKKRIKK